MKIIHIGPDSQFIQYLSGLFEAAVPGASHYLITSASITEKLKFPVKTESFTVLARGMRGALSIPMQVSSCDMIIVHGMSPYGVVAFLASPRKTVRVWSGWGFDYYGDELDPSTALLSDATRALLEDVSTNCRPLSLRKNISNKTFAYAKKYAARRTDYFSAPISSDLDVFKKKYKTFLGKYSQLNYGTTTEDVSRGSGTVTGSNILVGNSSSPTNNHADILDMLARHDLGARKVIVPLSYGDPIYREIIIKRGKDILGESFVPLVDFLPIEKYLSIIKSCNLVLMNHRRQQGLGNICNALSQGARVYLDTISPIYIFLMEKGAIVGNIRDLAADSLPLTRSSMEDVAKNRAVLEGVWGCDQVRDNVERLLNHVRTR